MCCVFWPQQRSGSLSEPSSLLSAVLWSCQLSFSFFLKALFFLYECKRSSKNSILNCSLPVSRHTKSLQKVSGKCTIWKNHAYISIFFFFLALKQAYLWTPCPMKCLPAQKHQRPGLTSSPASHHGAFTCMRPGSPRTTWHRGCSGACWF